MEIKSTQITLVPLEKLKEYYRNRNIHPEDQIAAIAEAIKAHGFRDELIVDKKTMEVIAGNGTLQAAKMLGMKEVPCSLQTFETEEKKYTFSISHNALQKRSFIDMSQIHLDIQELGPFDIADMGFKDFQFEPINEPDIGDFMEDEKEVMKFVTCPHCEKEFELKQAPVRIVK